MQQQSPRAVNEDSIAISVRLRNLLINNAEPPCGMKKIPLLSPAYVEATETVAAWLARPLSWLVWHRRAIAKRSETPHEVCDP
jgi:hypothetical protein